MTVQQERHFDVLVGGQGRDQGKELENETDVAAAHIGALVAVETGDILAVDQYRPAGGLVEAADQLQQGGFAGTGGTDQGGKFAAFDGQVDAAQGLGFDFANLVDTGDVFNFYDFHFVLLFSALISLRAGLRPVPCGKPSSPDTARPAMVTMKVRMVRLIVSFIVNLA